MNSRAQDLQTPLSVADKVSIPVLWLASLYFCMEALMMHDNLLTLHSVVIEDPHVLRYLKSWMYCAGALEGALITLAGIFMVERLRTGGASWLRLFYLVMSIAFGAVLLCIALQAAGGIWETMNQSVLLFDLVSLGALFLMGCWRSAVT